MGVRRDAAYGAPETSGGDTGAARSEPKGRLGRPLMILPHICWSESEQAGSYFSGRRPLLDVVTAGVVAPTTTSVVIWTIQPSRMRLNRFRSLITPQIQLTRA